MKHKYLDISSIKQPLKDIKTIVLLTMAAIFLLAVWAIFKLPIDQPMATLILDLGPEKRIFEGEAYPNMTILDTLIVSSTAGNVTFEYAYNENKEVQIIHLNDHSAYDPLVGFLFYLNSKPIQVSEIDKISIKPGDSIKVEAKRYEAAK